MKLYGYWRSLATFRVRVALALKGIALDEPEIAIDILQGKQFDAAYRKLNPQSVVPALVVDAGPPLFQSMAILEYLEETRPQPPLLPADARGRARVPTPSARPRAEGGPAARRSRAARTPPRSPHAPRAPRRRHSACSLRSPGRVECARLHRCA